VSVGEVEHRQLGAGRLQRLRLAELPSLLLYLPDLATQTEAARLHNAVRSLRARLDSIDRRQWENPIDTDAVGVEVAALQPGRDPEAWIDTLPFPLASILRRYDADADERMKVEHLLHFFEATAEFSCAVMLGAFRAQPELYEQNRPTWLRGLSSIRASTFGTWTTLAGRISATVSEMLDDPAQCLLLLDIFRTRREALPAALSNPALHGALQRARGIRNDTAHGGLEGKVEVRRRRAELEAELDQVRHGLQDAFRSTALLSLIAAHPQPSGRLHRLTAWHQPSRSHASQFDSDQSGPCRFPVKHSERPH
jgi:hypothetical protein